VLALRLGAIATTSTWSPRRSGEMLRWASTWPQREVQPVLEGGVPAHGLLFGRVGVDDDLHGDALLALLVARPSLIRGSCLFVWTVISHASSGAATGSPPR
jgi:hypothetical protein